MSALLESLTRPQNALSAETQLHAIRAAGLPGRREEAWRTTPLRALERRAFSPATLPQLAADCVTDIPAPRVVFANGHFIAALSDVSGTETAMRVSSSASNAAYQHAPGTAVFLEAIVEAQNSEGLSMVVLAGQSAQLNWVNIAVAADEDAVWHGQHHVHVMEGANLKLAEFHRSVDAPLHFSNTVCHLKLDAGAECAHVRVQDHAEGMLAFQTSRVELAAGARYERLDLELGSQLSRHVIEIALNAADTSCNAHGVVVADGKQHFDTRLTVRHAAGPSACDLRWRAIANGRSKIATHGGILIEAGADGSDAAFNSRNILLSNTATVESQPVLEIHADEVKAAHGSTVGQLDANALFYLQSRGIPADRARNILTKAFGNEVVDLVTDETLRTFANTALKHAMRSKTA